LTIRSARLPRAAAGGVRGRAIARGTAAVCVAVALLLATTRAPAPAAGQGAGARCAPVLHGRRYARRGRDQRL